MTPPSTPRLAEKPPESLSHFAAASFVVFVLKDIWSQVRGRQVQTDQLKNVRTFNEP